MMKLPGQSRRWRVNGKQPFDGVLVRAINADFADRAGLVTPSKMKSLSQESDFEGGELDDPIIAFAFYSNRYWANDGDQMLRSTDALANPDSTFEEDDTASTPTTDSLGDIELFNGDMYVSTDEVVYKLSGSTWSTAFSSLTANSKTLLKTVENRLYYTDNKVTVGSVNTSDTKATTTNTLDLQLSNNTNIAYDITMLEAGTNNLWIGTSNDSQAPNWVYAWNGETQNTFTSRYVITANVLAGLVYKKDNRPYIFDSKGRLQAFNGAGFETVAELPIEGTLNDDAVHYNGMTENSDGEILINFDNDTREGTYSPDAPSGVYAYHPEHGLYLKYAYTTQRVSETGSTGVDNFGHFEVNEVGAIFPADLHSQEGASDGTIYASAEINENGTLQNCIFLDNSNTDSLTKTTLVTRWMEANSPIDAFNEVTVTHDHLREGELVEIKVRTEQLPVVSDNSVPFSRYKLQTSKTEMAYLYDRRQKGLEVTMTTGADAGKSFDVVSVDKQGSSYILTLEGELSDTTNAQGFYIENWKTIKTNDNKTSNATKGKAGMKADKFQVKVDALLISSRLTSIFINNEPSTVV